MYLYYCWSYIGRTKYTSYSWFKIYCSGYLIFDKVGLRYFLWFLMLAEFIFGINCLADLRVNSEWKSFPDKELASSVYLDQISSQSGLIISISWDGSEKFNITPEQWCLFYQLYTDIYLPVENIQGNLYWFGL